MQILSKSFVCLFIFQGKTDEISNDSNVNVSFCGSMSGEWVSISGKASVSTDRTLVKQHYSPMLRSWMGDLGDGKHDGGPDDPRIGIIRVKPVTVTYVISNATIVGKAFEAVRGVVTGSPPDINALRELSQAEVDQARKLQVE